MRRILLVCVLLPLVLSMFLISPAQGSVRLMSYAMYRTRPAAIWTADPPPNSTTRFTQVDEAAYLWIRCQIDSDTSVMIQWIRPNGTIYLDDSRYLTVSKGKDWVVNPSGLSLQIAGMEAARSLGEWTVRVSARDSQGLYELFKQPFTIEAAASSFQATVTQTQTFRVVPNDPYFTRQWGLTRTLAPEAWGMEKGSSSVIVAIVDTGVDYSHPDLKSNMWTAPDGTYGWDFVDNDNDPMDTHGHGTMVAGVVGAIANNGIGVCGVSWNVKIMAVRVRVTLEMKYDIVAKGIRYAADHGARIINLSLLHGSGNYEEMRNAIDYAYSKGALIVESAGNSNIAIESEPQILNDKVMYVAGTDQYDAKAKDSSFGVRVSVCAPFYATTTNINGTYAFNLGGTSFSAPYVAGLAALLLSHNSMLTNDQMKQIIRATADNVDSVNPNYVGKLGSGRINAYRALKETASLIVTTANTVPGTAHVATITASGSMVSAHSSRGTEFLEKDGSNYDRTVEEEQ